MRRIAVPDVDTANAWRKAARLLLDDGVAPHAVEWGNAAAEAGLFDGLASGVLAGDTKAGALPAKRFKVPRGFVTLAERVCWHRDAERFARLYAFLWRLKDAPGLLSDRADPELARLRRMEKGVRRCQHKMKAFVRFREIGDPDDARRSFVAWFEPTHFTVEPTALFFAARFADMDWRIVTPEKTAAFVDGRLTFSPGASKPDLPEDAHEDLWVTYFRSIFNPARLKVQAMQSEMPKKYWKNMPEARAIPDLIASAPARARAMAEAAPTLPPLRAERIKRQWDTFQSPWQGSNDALLDAIRGCTRCPLHEPATQAVPGEGPRNADLMIVGEQPGDHEDLAGRPFVGPAGQLFDAVASEAGLDRSAAFLTNAVKHFKFVPRGKRRIHQRPNAGEIHHCRWWLDAEREMVRPKLIVAMGATAAEALTGSGHSIHKRRGTVDHLNDGTPVFLTVHPSYLLRLTDQAALLRERSAFRADLVAAMALLAKLIATAPRAAGR